MNYKDRYRAIARGGRQDGNTGQEPHQARPAAEGQPPGPESSPEPAPALVHIRAAIDGAIQRQAPALDILLEAVRVLGDETGPDGRQWATDTRAALLSRDSGQQLSLLETAAQKGKAKEAALLENLFGEGMQRMDTLQCFLAVAQRNVSLIFNLFETAQETVTGDTARGAKALDTTMQALEREWNRRKQTPKVASPAAVWEPPEPDAETGPEAGPGERDGPEPPTPGRNRERPSLKEAPAEPPAPCPAPKQPPTETEAAPAPGENPGASGKSAETRRDPRGAISNSSPTPGGDGRNPSGATAAPGTATEKADLSPERDGPAANTGDTETPGNADAPGEDTAPPILFRRPPPAPSDPLPDSWREAISRIRKAGRISENPDLLPRDSFGTFCPFCGKRGGTVTETRGTETFRCQHCGRAAGIVGLYARKIHVWDGNGPLNGSPLRQAIGGLGARFGIAVNDGDLLPYPATPPEEFPGDGPEETAPDGSSGARPAA